MCEFFKGWRRKAGCVTLVAACVTTSIWIPSITGYFASTIVVSDQVFVLMSDRGQFNCVTFKRGFNPVDWCFSKSPFLAGTRTD